MKDTISVNEKHLEFLQNNITRMNQCSFQMKGWSITIISALIAVYASSISDTNEGNKFFIFIAIVPAFLFWILDSLYLSKENKFVGIYNTLIKVDENSKIEISEYEIPVKKFKGWKYSLLRAMLSPSEIFLYLPIIIGLFLLGKFV